MRDPLFSCPSTVFVCCCCSSFPFSCSSCCLCSCFFEGLASTFQTFLEPIPDLSVFVYFLSALLAERLPLDEGLFVVVRLFLSAVAAVDEAVSVHPSAAPDGKKITFLVRSSTIDYIRHPPPPNLEMYWFQILRYFVLQFLLSMS
jgi:hypothetical protein